MKNDETDALYVSSRGLLKSCTIQPQLLESGITTLHYADWQYKAGDSIYVGNNALRCFVETVLSRLNKPFVLVSGDADETMPTELDNAHLQALIHSPLIQHWFCQNWIGTHPKVTILPIGQDYHTMQTPNGWGNVSTPLEQEAALHSLRQSYGSSENRLPKLYGNFHFALQTRYGQDRCDALQNIPSALIDYEPAHVPRLATWEHQARYAFTASPHGNGLDCHRTWEALALGCIPIVRTSPLNPLFQGLPVLIVQRWTDVTQQLLDKALIDFQTRSFDYERMTLRHWVDQIREKGHLSR